jgi:hypothetical protein
MSIASRAGLQKSRKGKIGPISAPQDGRRLNTDTMREGGPISLSAIGRQDVQVDTAPEAARRRELKRHEIDTGESQLEGETEKGEEEGVNQETFEEKINDGQQAWREGDNIIIEDEEGEVIRTISSPRSPERRLARQRFGKEVAEVGKKVEEKLGGDGESITGKLKRMWSGRRESWEKNQRRGEPDLESGVPEGEEEDEQDNRVAKVKSSPKAPASGPRIVVDEENRLTSHVSDRTERRARAEREQETDVERRRREAVLGLTQDSDEEDEGPLHPARSSGKEKAVESSSDDDEEEEDVEGRSEGVSSRSHSSAGGAESSSSGTQLLSPPAAARTRGIRFGDISVGQESFSLEEGPPSTGARHHRAGSGDWRVRWRTDS